MDSSASIFIGNMISVLAVMEEWRRNKSLSLTNVGYNKYFGLNSSTLSQTSDFEVQEDATKSQIKSAFKKSLNVKKMNKKVLGEFMQLIAFRLNTKKSLSEMKRFQDFMVECYSHLDESSLNRLHRKTKKGGTAVLSLLNVETNLKGKQKRSAQLAKDVRGAGLPILLKLRVGGLKTKVLRTRGRYPKNLM